MKTEKVFAERLKDLRMEEKLSVEKLAKNIGVSKAAISRWENGLQIPNIVYLVMIAKYFNVTTDYLCGLED